MRRRRNKRIISSKSAICIVTIALLNLAGISYATWNDSLNISSSLSTGYLNTVFGDQCILVDSDKNIVEDFYFWYEYDDEDNLVMRVDGEVPYGFNGFLKYTIKNKGTIPIKFKREEPDEVEGLDLNFTQKLGIIKPGKKISGVEQGNPQLNIKALKSGDHEFEIELPFRQWTK